MSEDGEQVDKIEPVSKVTVTREEAENAPEEKRIIDLSQRLADEYGIPLARAQQMMAIGQIFIDGELAHGDRIYYFNEEELVGKEVEVRDHPQSVKFYYRNEN